MHFFVKLSSHQALMSHIPLGIGTVLVEATLGNWELLSYLLNLQEELNCSTPLDIQGCILQ